MRSGAAQPGAAPTAASQVAPKPAPAATAPVASTKPATPAPVAQKPANDMEARLQAMNLPEEAIQAALAAAATKAAAPAAAAPAPAKPTTPAAPKTEAPKPQPAAKPSVAAPAPKPAPAPEPEPAAEPAEAILEPEAVAPTDTPQAETIVAEAAAQPAADPTEGMSDAEYEVWMAQQAETAAPVPTDAIVTREHTAEAGADEDDGHVEGAGQVVVRNHWSDKSKGALSGAIDRSDFKTPQLKLVQGQGDNAAKYGQGTTVFMDMVVFKAPTANEPTPFMRFVPVMLQKYFRENVEKNSKLKPRNVMTPEEVQKLGGTTEWTVDRAGNRVKPSWSPAAKITLLLEQPEGVEHPGFTMPIEVNGKISHWGAAVIYVNGGAYRSMAKPIIDATNFLLVEGDTIVLHKRIWKMQVVQEKSGDNWVFTPKVAIVNEATPADLRTFSESLLGGTR